MAGPSGPSGGCTHRLLAPCLCGQPLMALESPFFLPVSAPSGFCFSLAANTCLSIRGFWQSGWLRSGSCFVLFIIVVHETHYTVLSLKCFAVNHCGEDKQNNIDGEEIKENLGGFHWLVAPEFLNSDSRVSQKGTKNFSSCAWGLTDSPWWLRSKASLLRLSPINLAGCALQGLNATFLPAPHQEESGCFSGPCRVSPCT